jgi:Uma2 family endonuclease
MSATLAPPPIAPIPRRALFTSDEFHDMGDSGALEGRSVILVDGEILDMPNPNPPHDAVVGIIDYVLKAIFPLPNYWVRIQTGFPTTTDTDPVPDLAVVPGSPRDYPKKHPRVAVLIVEVADSSLAFDRSEKADLYAAAGIEDYWVVDLVNHQLLVFRDPVADSASRRGSSYRTKLALGPTDTVSPLAKPTAIISVADLLP